MGRTRKFKSGSPGVRFWSENGVVLWCVFGLSLCAMGAAVENPSGKEDIVPSTTVIIEENLASDHHNTEDLAYSYVVKSTEDPESAENHSGSHHDHHEERFHVASFDWPRVQTPMIVAVAILVALLAKLGTYLLCVQNTLV